MLEPSSAAIRLVFVYGTLRRGDVRDINRLHPSPRFVAMGKIAGTLYDLGPYPGIVLGGAGRVVGEVYEVSLELERVLDEIEEVWPQQTGEYQKREVTVQGVESRVSDSQELHCFVYEISTNRIQGCPVIASGDWMFERQPFQ
ncbi:MAG TPA: gamma-glutamylcyclotransferase family protein [Polaromonas sp.]|uniref:gamma-glutamylcyclotransferase family protein n=1 Tax=Polaromonas sp. TaxID=1869339 RepID=UPI002D2EA78D|nr:gamma-glutamylcyclotransferase family protein [Polaromonas sp.]HYW58035.1 gamma-glutamylcyclotransferase family protein [Polaromonas sp.]